MTSTTTTGTIPFDEPEALVPPKPVAEHFHTTEDVLAQHRYRGVGIPYVRHGRRIFYRVRDIRTYLDANTKTPGA
jgi:hypothetical protein